MLKGALRMTLLPVVFFCSAFIASDHENFPVPEDVKDLLFYVQRSINKNTIIYRLNTTADNEPNEKDPISMYWVNYSGKGDTEPLNYIQKKYAYGLDVHLIDKEKKTFCFSFVSYKKQMLYLIRSPDKKYHVYSYFNNRLMMVNSIYVHIDGGSFWTPKVKYIEVSGKDPVKNEELVEKINV
jgi:hypothetical protein